MHVHVHDRSAATSRRLQISFWITAAFIVIELVGGLRAQSLALLSDAGHNFTDALALGLAWFACLWTRRPPTATKTYGYHRAGVLAAFVNALTLVALALYIFYESYHRFLAPRVVDETIMIVIAGAGLVVNLAVMRALHADSKHDLNVRGAFVHMLGDALGSVGIIIGGLAIRWTSLEWIDPALSVLIGGLILWTAWDVIRESLDILLEGLPKGVPFEGVVSAIRDVDGVLDVHDLHVWSLSASARALSCHVVIRDLPPSESARILERINHALDHHFEIRHTTIQFEHVGCEHAEEICSGADLEAVGAHRH